MRRSVGRFQIEREAGTGGVGTVYRARDPETGQVVAVKVMRGVVDADLKRFAREARILAQIRHRGVVRYIEHGIDGPGEAYLVMEWLEGEDLRARLGRGELSLAESVTLGLRAAEALGTIHAHGLIHRDIKPGNVFLPGGAVSDLKIIDFGLARGDGSLGPTQTGVIIGTPSYMAPEQARGERAIDARADLYSLGCVLFKAITGRVPFPGQEILSVLSKVLSEEPPRVRELRPEVPAALDDLLGRLLAKDREARPESAAAVVEVLSALAPSGMRERPHSMPPSAVMAGEQRRVVMLLVGAREGALGPEEDEGLAARIREHGGQLDRLPDGTPAVVFAGGWALASDQAARAARCALALHELAPATPMVLATCASEVGGQHLVGPAVEAAAGRLRRADASPRGAEIVVDALTAALLDARFEVRSGEGGLTLHALRELDSGARRVLGKETPFVGRDWELSSILGLLDRAVDDELALALLVTAPAGAGKTRLGREVVRAVAARRPEVEVWRGRADPLRAGSALSLLGQILRGAAGLPDGDPLASLGARLEKRLARSLPPADALRVTQLLCETLGHPLPGDPGPELRAARRDPRLMAEQTQRAFRDFVGAERSRAPGLVVIEDLQWADPSTLRFLDDALAAHARLPWMVLAFARPEVADLHPRLWKDRNVQEIRLKPLPRRASERLVHEVLGDRVDAEAAARLAARADGNAFYLEELIRAEAARVTGPAAGTLPETILAMVQTRFEALEPEERRALRAASVFGEVFWPGGVAALLGGATGPGEGWIDALLAREILVRHRESRLPGEPQLAFRHALLREGAYAMLTDRDRALGHRLAGEWLLAHGEGDPVVLARHFDLARDPARAGAFHLGAAERALRGADVEAALAEAEQALASGISGEPLHECLGVLCEAHAWRTEWDQVIRYAVQVSTLAAPGTTPWIRGVTARHAAAFSRGDPVELMESLYTLMGVDPTPEATTTVVRCLSVSVLVCSLMTRFTLVDALATRLDDLLALTAGDAVAAGWVHLAHTWRDTWKVGDLSGALHQCDAARRSFEAAADLRSSQLARVFAATVRWNLGLFAEAEALLRGVVPAADEHLVALILDYHLVLVLVDRGALAEARTIAARRLAGAGGGAASTAALRTAEARWLLSEVDVRAGDLASASRALGESLDALRARPLHWEHAAVTLGTIHLRRGRPDEALRVAREVRATIAAHGGAGHRPGRHRLLLAEALLAVGDAPAADAAIAAAYAELQARAAGIPDERARHAFLTALPEHARTIELAVERLVRR